MEIWTLIVKSNTFNFAILLFLIILLIKFLNVKSKLEGAQKKVEESVNNSTKAKEESQTKLNLALDEVKNIAHDIKKIFDTAEINAKNMGEKILYEANKQVENIETNSKKALEKEDKKTALKLKEKTALASLELAKEHLIKTLENNPNYHNELIKKSIEELEGLKINE